MYNNSIVLYTNGLFSYLTEMTWLSQSYATGEDLLSVTHFHFKDNPFVYWYTQVFKKVIVSLLELDITTSSRMLNGVRDGNKCRRISGLSIRK